MFPLDSRPGRSRWRLGLSAPALAAAVLVTGAAALALLVAGGTAAASAPPRATAEPVISGSAEQGRRLSASRGSWTGTNPISFAYRWVRCGADGGSADGSNCVFVQGATASTYVLTGADVGFRMRVRVTGTNAEGSRTVASNPTATVAGAPVNTSIPLVTGTPLVDATLTIQPGGWSGRQPISFTYAWVRCNTAGGECAAIAGATRRTYRLTASDVNHRLRANVTARNAIGQTTVLSSESGVVSVPLPPGAIRLPNGQVSIPAASVPSDQRLVVSQVGFSPNPVTTRSKPITVRVLVRDTRGYVVRDALVFVRSTPRVTSGSRQVTTLDGTMTTQLVPLDRFPLKKHGRVQFFVKTYRSGDPELAGVAGYRLVQVRTANV